MRTMNVSIYKNTMNVLYYESGLTMVPSRTNCRTRIF